MVLAGKLLLTKQAPHKNHQNMSSVMLKNIYNLDSGLKCCAVYIYVHKQCVCVRISVCVNGCVHVCVYDRAFVGCVVFILKSIVFLVFLLTFFLH